MTALYNYGWTGILALIVVYVVQKFHRPVLVWSWASLMKRHGATKCEVRDDVAKEAAKNGQDFLIELTRGANSNSSNSESPGESPAPAVGGPVAPSRPKRPAKTSTPSSATKRTCTNPKARKAADESAASSPVPEPAAPDGTRSRMRPEAARRGRTARSREGGTRPRSPL